MNRFDGEQVIRTGRGLARAIENETPGLYRPLIGNPEALRKVSPGTPRHPAYPSGHSTYSAAASEILSYFFGNDEVPSFLDPDPGDRLKDEFDRLADNIGVGRLWAGVHWRSDHEAGQKLGRTVACLVLRQLASMRVVNPKGKVVTFNLCPPEPAMPCDPCDLDVKLDPCDPNKKPPKRSDLCTAADLVAKACPPKDDTPPQEPCAAPPPCRKDGKKDGRDWKARVNAYRGPQQGGR